MRIIIDLGFFRYFFKVIRMAGGLVRLGRTSLEFIKTFIFRQSVSKNFIRSFYEFQDPNTIIWFSVYDPVRRVMR